MTCGFDEIRRARVRSPTRPSDSDGRRPRMPCVDVQDHLSRAGVGIRSTRTESDSATARTGACSGVQCSGKRKNRPPDLSSRRRPV